MELTIRRDKKLQDAQWQNRIEHRKRRGSAEAIQVTIHRITKARSASMMQHTNDEDEEIR